MATNGKWLLSGVLCFILLAVNVYNIGISVSNPLIVPEKIVSPSFDGHVEEKEWIGAVKLEFNFTFSNGESHKAEVYLARNASHFFVGAVIHSLGPNPFTITNKVTFPDGFNIYFDVDNDGNLTQPEDSKGLVNFISFDNGTVYFDGSFSADSFWNYASALADGWQKRRPETNGKVLWTPDENVAESDVSTYGSGYYSGGMSGDEHFEFTFPLHNNDVIADGFQVKAGESKIMGFALEFYRQTYSYENGTEGQDLYDYFPGEGFTPDVIINPSQWAKLSVNLGSPTTSVPDLRILPIAIIIIAIILVVLTWKLTKHK